MKPFWKNNDCRLYQGDNIKVLKRLEAGSVHTIITSPPYWNLRDYQTGGDQLGIEDDYRDYIAKLVALGRELKTVLHDSGTFWLNLGDTYSGHNDSSQKWRSGNESKNHGNSNKNGAPKVQGMSGKNLMGIPWRVAFALQDDGWILRSAFPWVKRGCMPDSATDRPSSAVEYWFMLAKQPKYFYDQVAVRPKAVSLPHAMGNKKAPSVGFGGANNIGDVNRIVGDGTRNLRNADLWFQSVDTPHGLTGVGDEIVGTDSSFEPLRIEHFAAFATKMIKPFVLAGSSAKGCCPGCRSPWNRIVEKQRESTRPALDSKVEGKTASEFGNRDPARHVTKMKTAGWEPSCKCDAGEPEPCTILDPFAGTCTVGVVAQRHGRKFIGIDLSDVYLEMGKQRLLSRGDYGKSVVKKTEGGFGFFKQ